MTQDLKLTDKDLVSATKGIWINENQISFSKIVTDSRIDCTEAIFIAISGEIFDGHNFINNAIEQNAKAICIDEEKFDSLNIPENIPVLKVKNTTKAYQDIAHFYRNRLKNCTIIGLTGSNGKTSTKDILYSILSKEFGTEKVYATKANTNNHIGVPQNILSVTHLHEYAIIEMGTNHPGDLSVLVNIVKPDIAILTSIGPSHLEFFKNLEGVAKEKASIFQNFNKIKNNYAVIPFECPEIETVKKYIPNESTVIKTFGFKNTADTYITDYKTFLTYSNFLLNWKNDLNTYFIETALIGKHQALNTAAAVTVADILKIKHSKIIEYIKAPVLTGMRMQISSFKDIICINDAYNANPASTKAGLEYLMEIIKSGEKLNSLHIVLGDMLELGDTTVEEHLNILKKAVKIKYNCKIYAVGKIMSKAVDILNNSNIVKLPDKISAGKFLSEHVRKKDIIYLKSSNSTGLKEIETILKEIL